METRGTKPCCRIANATKYGCFKRKSDAQKQQRYRCRTCLKTFSPATNSPLKWQKKRHINQPLLELLASNFTLSKAAMFFRVNPKTIAKKLTFLGSMCQKKLAKQMARYQSVCAIQFDELQTIEHTKCKPLSVGVVVCKKSRKILGFKVSKMPATGHLAEISRKKYGPRPDNRRKSLEALFKHLTSYLKPNITIESDECTYYAPIARRYFPKGKHHQYKGKKGSVAGQGELKCHGFDPIFCINHTLAMLRANISRLIRRTWNTTKKISALESHLNIYTWYHNNFATPHLNLLIES